MNDLSLVTTEQLIDELLSRCDSGVISIRLDKTQEEGIGDTGWKGDPWTCIGLLEFLKTSIIKTVNEESE